MQEQVNWCWIPHFSSLPSPLSHSKYANIPGLIYQLPKVPSPSFSPSLFKKARSCHGSIIWSFIIMNHEKFLLYLQVSGPVETTIVFSHKSFFENIVFVILFNRSTKNYFYPWAPDNRLCCGVIFIFCETTTHGGTTAVSNLWIITEEVEKENVWVTKLKIQLIQALYLFF